MGETSLKLSDMPSQIDYPLGVERLTNFRRKCSRESPMRLGLNVFDLLFYANRKPVSELLKTGANRPI